MAGAVVVFGLQFDVSHIVGTARTGKNLDGICVYVRILADGFARSNRFGLLVFDVPFIAIVVLICSFWSSVGHLHSSRL
jgi:hypothetical protein